MLNSLYKKLYILFTVSVMLIITFVISFAVASAVNTDRTNESTMFQRMVTLLIYQLENTPSDMNNTICSYEEKYHLYAWIENSEGQEIYRSDFPFPAQADILMGDVPEQNSRQQIAPEGAGGTVTSQGGIYEITGTDGKCYYAIPAAIAAAGRYEYQAVFIYPVSDLKTSLVRLLPRYSAAWVFALAGVLVIMRFLLKKAFTPTERVLKSQKDFVATASHELKSPLAVMIANTDVLLENKSLDETARQAAGTIEAECMRLSRLVKDMLLLSSSDARAWSLHESDVDMDTLLITLYETYEQTCMKNGIELKLELSEDSYPPLRTDKDRLFQILCIFMDNAIQHSENNPLIEIQAASSGNQISFSIADHGQGISDEEKKWIFGRFYSGDKSHTNKTNFGLGLSIAEELAKMLKGRIQVSDTPGGGATFTILL